jgi:hypothetical protein
MRPSQPVRKACALRVRLELGSSARRETCACERPRLAGRARLEAAIANDLARSDHKPVQSVMVSGSSVLSPGLGDAVATARMNPRSPRRVFAVASAISAT